MTGGGRGATTGRGAARGGIAANAGRHALRATVAAVAGWLLIPAAAAALPPDAPHPRDMVFDDVTFEPPVPVRFELPNGLVVYHLEDHTLPLVAVRALIRAGSVHEPADRAGLAGLVGTVMRSGGTLGREPDRLDEELEDMASHVETSIGRESASASASSLERHFPATLEILADVLRRPAFREEKLEIARGRAIEALRRQNDRPRPVAAREHRTLVYGDHPYGRTPTLATVRAIERRDLVDFHARFFRPGNTILAVSGAVSTDELRRLLDAHLGDWESGAVDFPPVPEAPSLPAAGAPSVHHIEMDVPQSAIRLGHLGIDRFDPDRYAVAVMNHVLGRGGLISRLAQRVRVQEGIAYSAGSVFTLPLDTGMFSVFTETQSSSTVRAVRLLTEEIERMRDRGLSAEEFADARSAILNRDIFRYTTPSQIVAQIAMLEFDGLPSDQLQRDIAAYKSLTIDAVNGAARRYLHPDSLVVLVVGKAADFDTALAALGPVREIELERPVDEGAAGARAPAGAGQR